MKCKYYDKCEHASSTSMTCTENGGGTYCGKYRVLAARSNSFDNNIHALTDFPVPQRQVPV